jgi:hypothetical protein
MAPAGDVTFWIAQAKAGNREAAQWLLGHYFHQLVALARGKLRGARQRDRDGEDVALSAFDSFYRAAGRGCFPKLNDRQDLWQLLVLITCRKAADLVDYWNCLKRVAECGESGLGPPPSDPDAGRPIGAGGGARAGPGGGRRGGGGVYPAAGAAGRAPAADRELEAGGLHEPGDSGQAGARAGRRGEEAPAHPRDLEGGGRARGRRGRSCGPEVGALRGCRDDFRVPFGGAEEAGAPPGPAPRETEP